MKATCGELQETSGNQAYQVSIAKNGVLRDRETWDEETQIGGPGNTKLSQIGDKERQAATMQDSNA
jgi:hypothetical protein